jgi:V/A-type H+-transporting ATPase subunit A
MEAARSIREDFLHQLAFHEIDTYTSLNKQYRMMKLVINYYDQSLEALAAGAGIEELVALPVRESIGRFKYVLEENVDEEYAKVCSELDSQLKLAAARKEDY